MKRILVINGPNLDMLGKRNPSVYGTTDYKTLLLMIKKKGREENVRITARQYYEEGKIAKTIAHSNADGLILNAGGYSHYSVAIRDAIEANAKIKTAVLHISDIERREDFRRNDILKDVADVYIAGRGIKGYLDAIEELKKII